MNRVAVVFSLLLTASLSAHPFHGSIAEAEWNATTKKLEVALWVHPGDLEQTLRSRTKKPIDLEKTPKVDGLIEAYLRETFVVRDNKGVARKPEWLGKEVTAKAVWLYFEVPLPNGLEGVTFHNRIFFELLKDQVNTITFRKGKARKSYGFTQNKPKRVFAWKN